MGDFTCGYCGKFYCKGSCEPPSIIPGRNKNWLSAPSWWDYEKNEDFPWNYNEDSKELIWMKCDNDHEWQEPFNLVVRQRQRVCCQECLKHSRRG